MEITIKDIENSIKKILGDFDVLNTESVYERIDGDDDLKLVIFINKMFAENVILYTKFIFKVDKNKTKLTNNSFLYLYDINCQYVNVDFSDINDFERKLKSIFKNNKFGPDLKILSEFVEKPSFLINDWLKKNGINEISVYNVKYDPKTYVMPCKSLFFSFKMDVNNITIPFSVRKDNSEYVLSFNINDEIINIELNNLKNLIQSIGMTLKNKLK